MRIFPVRYPARVDGVIVDRQLKQDARISPEIDNQLCRSAGSNAKGEYRQSIALPMACSMFPVRSTGEFDTLAWPKHKTGWLSGRTTSPLPGQGPKCAPACATRRASAQETLNGLEYGYVSPRRPCRAACAPISHAARRAYPQVGPSLYLCKTFVFDPARLSHRRVRSGCALHLCLYSGDST